MKLSSISYPDQSHVLHVSLVSGVSHEIVQKTLDVDAEHRFVQASAVVRQDTFVRAFYSWSVGKLSRVRFNIGETLVVTAGYKDLQRFVYIGDDIFVQLKSHENPYEQVLIPRATLISMLADYCPAPGGTDAASDFVVELFAQEA